MRGPVDEQGDGCHDEDDGVLNRVEKRHDGILFDYRHIVGERRKVVGGVGFSVVLGVAGYDAALDIGPQISDGIDDELLLDKGAAYGDGEEHDDVGCDDSYHGGEELPVSAGDSIEDVFQDNGRSNGERGACGAHDHDDGEEGFVVSEELEHGLLLFLWAVVCLRDTY